VACKPALLRPCTALLAAAGAFIAGTAPSQAQEQFVMPYRCTSSSGRVVLAPAREQSYRIYGVHEQRQFTACSPVNPKLCRSWRLHRFDIDCGGARVSWLSVVGAASEQRTGRAWVENGRLRMRMGPWWAIGSDPGRFGPYTWRDRTPQDPCPPGRWPGRYDDDCMDARFDRGRIRAPVVVELPPGFAPLLDLAGAFIGQETPHAAAKSPNARAEPPQQMAPKMSRVEPGRDVPGKVAGVQTLPATPDRSPATAQPPVPVAAMAVPTASAGPVGPAVPQTTTAAEVATRSSTSSDPKILNRPAAASSTDKDLANPSMAAWQREPPGGRPTGTDAASLPAPDAAATRDIAPAAPPRPDNKTTHALRRPQMSGSLTAATGISTGQAVFGFAGVITVMLSLFAWTRARESRRMAAAGAREVASVALDGDAASAPGYRLSTTGHTQRGRPAPHAPPLAAQSPAPLALPDDWLPRNREEACRIIGASPDASEAVIKKIVDALRQSWHPDHAAGSADQGAREQRMKQINVAWDIISGKRTQH
jgi:hypothetical protein